MAKVIIGGEEIEVDLPNFKALKAAWKYIAVVQGNSDPMAGVDAILGLITVGKVGAPVTVEELEEKLTPTEALKNLRPFVNDLMVEVGLAERPAGDGSGEAAPAGGTAASPSEETSEP